MGWKNREKESDESQKIKIDRGGCDLFGVAKEASIVSVHGAVGNQLVYVTVVDPLLVHHYPCPDLDRVIDHDLSGTRIVKEGCVEAERLGGKKSKRKECLPGI